MCLDGKVINLFEEKEKKNKTTKDEWYINYSELSEEDKRLVDKQRGEQYRMYYQEESQESESENDKTE